MSISIPVFQLNTELQINVTVYYVPKCGEVDMKLDVECEQPSQTINCHSLERSLFRQSLHIAAAMLIMLRVTVRLTILLIMAKSAMWTHSQAELPSNRPPGQLASHPATQRVGPPSHDASLSSLASHPAVCQWPSACQLDASGCCHPVYSANTGQGKDAARLWSLN